MGVKNLYSFAASHPGIEQVTLRYFKNPFVLSVFLAYGDTGKNLYWDYIQGKTIPEGYGPLLPSLTALRFENCTPVYDGTLPLASMTDLLEARPALSFFGSNYFDSEKMEWLDKVETRFRHRIVQSPYARSL